MYTTESIIWATMAVVAAVFLWDPDGLALGASILSLGGFLSKIIEGIGDTLWIGGCFLIVMGGVAFYAVGRMTNERIEGLEYVRNYIYKLGTDPDIFSNLPPSTMNKSIIGLGFFGIISGFWFSGFAILFLIWGIRHFTAVFTKQNREYHERMKANGFGG